MNKRLVIPLLMYKEVGSVNKGTKRSTYVVPTWNHLYTIRRMGKIVQPILDKWALLHKEKITDITKEWVSENKWEMTQGRKVYVRFWIYWNDAREKDCHNIDKLPMDAFNEVIYDDDSNALIQIMDFDIDMDNPRIEIEFEVGDFFNRKERVGAIKGEKKKKEREEKNRLRDLERASKIVKKENEKASSIKPKRKAKTVD